MTTIAAPSANQIQSTLAASYTRGTDTTVVLVDGSLFPSPTPLGHVIWIRDTFAFTVATKWCLIIYTSRATNTLTMGGGATDYALAKNVTVGDEAYEWPIGSYVELVSAADEIAHLFARVAAAIHDDVAGEILAIDQDTAPIGTHEILSENAAGTKKAIPLANLAYGNPPLGQAGDASWANRTYEGWEIFDTVHTYTVGTVGGEDFATLAAAAAALKGLILIVSPTVQLTGDITLTADVTFSGLISAGGKFEIDLNGFDISIGAGCSSGIIGNGPFEMIYKTLNGASVIVLTAGAASPPYYMIAAYNGCLLNLIGAASGNTLTVDAASEAIVAPITIAKAKGRFYSVVYSNIGSCVKGGVYATETSHGGFILTDPAALTADRGSILIKTDGTVVTT